MDHYRLPWGDILDGGFRADAPPLRAFPIKGGTGDTQANHVSKLLPATLGYAVPSDWAIRLVRGFWPAQMVVTDERLHYYQATGIIRLDGAYLNFSQAYGWAQYGVVERNVRAQLRACALVACELEVGYRPEWNAEHQL